MTTRCLSWLACGAVILMLTSCKGAPSREEVVSSLVTTQLVPHTTALARDAAALTAATQKLGARSSSEALDNVRSAWRKSLLSWERVYAFRVGPIVEDSGLLRSRFWPVRIEILKKLLQQNEPLTEPKVDQLGVDLRGMYALEWLLFDRSAVALLISDTPDGQRARAAAVAFAQNIQKYAQGAADRLGTGEALKGTGRAQEIVSLLCNQMVATIEALASDRVKPVLDMHAQSGVRMSQVQGAPSGMSRELVRAQLLGSEDIYLGTNGLGLSSLVAPVAPSIDQNVRERFTRAHALLKRLALPLEQAVLHDRIHVMEALDGLKQLELALKVDLTSALGITLTFTSGDGD